MFGATIGDVVGSRWEFNNIKTKDFELFGKGCYATDDTVMTCAVAEVLANKKQDDKEYIIDTLKSGAEDIHTQAMAGISAAGC